MTKPRVLVLTGYGINCDDETAFAFSRAGADADIVHINDLIENPPSLTGTRSFPSPADFPTATTPAAARPWATGSRTT